MGGSDDPLATYARRLQEQLHPDLASAEQERARLHEQIREYQDLARELDFLHQVIPSSVCCDFARSLPGARQRSLECCKQAPCLPRSGGPRARLCHVQSGTHSFDAKVPIGSDVAVRARVPDASKVVIQTGLQFWTECTADEAQPFIDAQVAFLERRAARSSARIATIRTHARLTEQAMAELAATLQPQ